MSRGLRLFGHPLHAALVHFPMGFLSLVPLWDAAAIWRGGSSWWGMSFWTLAAGWFLALPAAVAGLWDYTDMDGGHQGRKDADRHLLLMGTALVLHMASLLARSGPDPMSGGRLRVAVLLSALGAGVLGWGGWYGGHLVYHHKIGVEEK
jgi:uncharacterized membrane protein